MRKHINLLALAFILFTTFALIVSCNNGDDEKKATGSYVADTSKKTPDVSQEQPKAKAMAIAGYLDNLYVLKADFDTIPKAKLVFSFTFREPDALTLSGWRCRGSSANCNGTYFDNPSVKLIKYSSSGVAYGPVVYFSDVILKKTAVEKIQDNYPGYQYVVFVPKNDYGFISYSIHVTNDPPPPAPDSVKVLALDPTNQTANPSPPKGYN